MRFATPSSQIFLKVLDTASHEADGAKRPRQATSPHHRRGHATPCTWRQEQAGSHKVDVTPTSTTCTCDRYELLTGFRTVYRQTLTGVLISHLTKPPPPFTTPGAEPLQARHASAP